MGTSSCSMTNLHRQLQSGKDVLHFGLEHFWSQFAFSNPQLVGEEDHLQDERQTQWQMLPEQIKFNLAKVHFSISITLASPHLVTFLEQAG